MVNLNHPTQTEWRDRQVQGQINKVPRLWTEDGKLYLPVMVSLGPYHHGQKKSFIRAENFKYIILDWFSRSSEGRKLELYNRILGSIDDIRRCYAEVEIVNKYDDEALAKMMLLDACFIINFMVNTCLNHVTIKANSIIAVEIDNNITADITVKIRCNSIIAVQSSNNSIVAGQRSNYNIITVGLRNNDNIIAAEIQLEMRTNRIIKVKVWNNNTEDWIDYLGQASACQFAARDMVLLENQVPYSVITMLMGLLYVNAADMSKRVLAAFINWTTENRDFGQDTEEEQPPIHLLEACWRAFQTPNQVANKLPFSQLIITNPQNHLLNKKNLAAVSLKAKGIRFRPTSSQSLNDITFESSYLHLPIRSISPLTPVLLSNLIAYEVSPTSRIEPVVLSYTNLMKSLIQTTNDVKELQKNGILLNSFEFANDQQVVQMFRDINTFGHARLDSFRDLKLEINTHCEAKINTRCEDKIKPISISQYFVSTKFQATFVAIVGLIALLLSIILMMLYAIRCPAK